MSSLPSTPNRQSKMELGNWATLFPSELQHETQSLKFIKKMLAISVSNIMYLRSELPGKCLTFDL